MFDEAFAAADAEGFSLMAEGQAAVRNASGATVSVAAIESPLEVGGSYRAGGRVEEVSLQLECPAAPLLAEGFRDGSIVHWKGEDYKVLQMTRQGDTMTMTCGSMGDSSGNW